MDLGLVLLGMLLMVIGMLLTALSLRRRDNVMLIMIGPIPIITNKKEYLVIPIIVIIVVILLMLI